jgi:hypothetical protein
MIIGHDESGSANDAFRVNRACMSGQDYLIIK